MLGTIGDGDIGTHFPPSDPQWQGVSSEQFLTYAIKRVREAGGILTHLDLTLICETPKITPYRPHMKRVLARLTGLEDNRLSIKATTSEGWALRTQRRIAALAQVTIELART